MKILSLVTVPSSQQGGMEWATLEVNQGLANRGHEIALVHRENGDFLPLYQNFCASVTQTRFHQAYIKNPVHSCLSIAKALAPILRLNPDVVYVQKYHNSFFGALVARIKNIPMVCHLRAFPPKESFNRQWSFGLSSTTRCIAVSAATKKAYVEAGFTPETIKVVYDGVSLDRFLAAGDRNTTRQELGLSPDAFVVLYAGRVDPPKNIEMLIRAFAQLKLAMPEARLVIVGGPVNHITSEAGERYVESLKRLCRELNVAEAAQFLGKRPDMPAMYRMADVTVLPSLLPDTFGRTLAESMACGTPAIGLRYGGIPEVIADEFSKFQFDVGDVAGLAHMLQSLNGWQGFDPMLSERCQRYAKQRFDDKRAAIEVESALAEAVQLGPKRLGPASKDLQHWGDKVSANSDFFRGLTAW